LNVTQILYNDKQHQRLTEQNVIRVQSRFLSIITLHQVHKVDHSTNFSSLLMWII